MKKKTIVVAGNEPREGSASTTTQRQQPTVKVEVIEVVEGRQEAFELAMNCSNG